MAYQGLIPVLLQDFLTQALSVKVISLRQLFRPIDYPFIEMKKQNSLMNRWRRRAAGRHFERGVALLVAIYGTEIDLLKALSKIRDNSSTHVPDDTTQIIYRWLADLMLKRMVPLKEVGKTPWLGKYSLEMSNQDFDGSQQSIALVGGAHAHFFYSTLFEYVRRSIYKK